MRWLSKQRSALADEFEESYVDWREACEDVRAAYGRWAQCPPQQRGLRFATYRAALEREESAAGIHHDWVKRIRALAG
jgi:acyl-CoA reductase-like NAD-dependent aldehyde dehydrogenase